MHRRLVPRTTAAFALLEALLLVLLLVVPGGVALASAPLDQAQAAVRQLQAQIERLDGQMKSAEGRYTEAEQRLAAVQNGMTANRHDQTGIEAKLAKSQDALARFVVQAYKMPRASFLDALMSAHSLSDVLGVFESVSRLGRQGADALAAVREAKRELAQKQSALTGEQRQATKLLDGINKEKAQIDQALRARKDALGGAQTQVKQALQQIAAEKAAAAARAAAAAEAKQKAEAAAAAAAAAKAKQEAAAKARSTTTTGPSGTAGGSSPPGATLSDYTPTTWARALLQKGGLPVTSSNTRAIVAWEMAEGGHWYNSARYNPLNTTISEPGAVSINAVGVKAYTSWDQGLTATIATLFNGHYGGILSALKAGNDAQAVASAVAASPWGTGPFSVA